MRTVHHRARWASLVLLSAALGACGGDDVAEVALSVRLAAPPPPGVALDRLVLTLARVELVPFEATGRAVEPWLTVATPVEAGAPGPPPPAPALVLPAHRGIYWGVRLAVSGEGALRLEGTIDGAPFSAVLAPTVDLASFDHVEIGGDGAGARDGLTLALRLDALLTDPATRGRLDPRAPAAAAAIARNLSSAIRIFEDDDGDGAPDPEPIPDPDELRAER